LVATLASSVHGRLAASTLGASERRIFEQAVTILSS
jgi:hypothetical protein